MLKINTRIAGLTMAACLAIGLTAIDGAQERTRDKQPAGFKQVYASIQQHYEAKSYGKAVAATRELLGLISAKRSAVILAALPAAPDGYTVKPQKKEQANPLAGMLAASVGSSVVQEYTGPAGTLRVTVTADSPMLQMMGMMFENPAMLGPDAELIKYDQCKAILKKEGSDRWSLQFLIDKTMVEAKFGNENDEFALKMFNQAAVTKLRAAITN